MFDGITGKRASEMSSQELRLLDNIKKAFHYSDKASQDRFCEDKCIEELLKAVDTAKSLRRSLRGEDISHHENRKRFIHFLNLEIPAPENGGPSFDFPDVKNPGQLRKWTFSEIVYAIRCKIHENENLNIDEDCEFFIQLDWKITDPRVLGYFNNDVFICNARFLWNRIRQILAKFITGIEAMIAIHQGKSFCISINPEINVIRPKKLQDK